MSIEHVPTTSERPAHEEPLAFSHEHARLYDALERAAQRAELAGHDGMADGLRSLRRDVAREIGDRQCAYRLDRSSPRTTPPRGSKANDYGPELVPRAGRRD